MPQAWVHRVNELQKERKRRETVLCNLFRRWVWDGPHGGKGQRDQLQTGNRKRVAYAKAQMTGR